MESDEAKNSNPEELRRHQNLLRSIQELIHVYETDPENMPKLMELFEKSQSYGAPPESVYESLAENTEGALDDQEGLPQCFQQ